MKKSIVMLIVAVTVATAVPAFAELQNVVVGGQIRIRGNWLDYDKGAANTNTFVEQRTRLNVRADFTDNVSAFIELDSYGNWGEGFRSNYVNGVDARPIAANGAGDSLDAQVYQAYIEAKEMWGTALKARIGRQEIKLGSGWLIGTGDTAPYFYGLSFDAARLTYATDQFSIDAIAAKLADTSPVSEDGDIDLYGLYGSYLGIENITLDAYALMIRDAVNTKTDARTKLDVGGSVETYTFGLRGAGTVGALDFDAEVAYQLVDWDKGTLDKNGDGKVDKTDYANFADLQKVDADTSTDSIGANLEVGYTFDMKWTPRVFVAGCFLEGEDAETTVVNKVTYTTSPAASFNRLFSDVSYSKILDTTECANALSNLWTVAAGVSAAPVESVKLQLSGSYLGMVENFGGPDSYGWELDASAVYNYTQDLAIKGGYSHLFAEDGTVANFAIDDVNYFYLETKVAF